MSESLNSNSVVSLKDVRLTYDESGSPVNALDGVNLEIADGSFSAITGPSGCGKSTLLHVIGALDSPDSGEVTVAGFDLKSASEKQRTKFRREVVGFVFQFFNLVPTLTIAENVALPLVLQGKKNSEANKRALEFLELVGLEKRSKHFPHQVSGGEMQRSAVARALVHQPKLILADEPTGNLDTENADLVMDALRKVHEMGLATLLVVTHSRQLAATAPDQINVKDGKIVGS